jgi:hypothetical protein
MTSSSVASSESELITEMALSFVVMFSPSGCGHQREVFPTPPQTKRKTSNNQSILPTPAHVAYNGRRAEGPCGKTMLGDRLKSGLENPMSTDGRIIPGIVKNGVVVPRANSALPDGAHVNIVLQPAEMPQELKEELEAWQRAGDQAWQMIDKWESEEP